MDKRELKALLKQLGWSIDPKRIGNGIYYNAAKRHYPTIYLGKLEDLTEDNVRAKIRKAVRKD